MGDYVTFDFTGNNMPIVTLAAKNITNDYRNVVTTDGNKFAKDKTDTGFVISNGYVGAPGENDYHTNAPFNRRINVYGPYRHQAVEGESADQVRGSAGLDTGVGFQELIGSTDKFRMIVGIEEFTATQVKIGIVVVNLTAHENGETQRHQPVYNTVVLDISTFGFESAFEGNIILHGRLGMDTKLDKVYTIYENTDNGMVKWSIPGSNF